MRKILLAFAALASAFTVAQTRCTVPVSDATFQQNFNQIAVLRGDAAKQERSVSFVTANCVKSQQVKTLALLFTSDSVRLIFCKAAYPKVTDTLNFFNVYDAFTSFSYAIRMYDYTQHYRWGKSTVITNTVIVTPPPPPANTAITYPAWSYPDTARTIANKGCAGPVVNETTFNSLAENVKKQPSEESKIVAIESAATNNCLSTAQAMKLSSFLTLEENRLRILKNTLPRVYDQEHYNYSMNVLTTQAKKDEWVAYAVSYLTPPCTVSANEFNNLIGQIRAKTFDDDQLTLVKDMSKDRCFNVEQLKVISNEFTFDDEKTEVFKTCYAKCPDKQNYYQLVDKLTFTSAKDELRRFINAGGK